MSHFCKNIQFSNFKRLFKYNVPCALTTSSEILYIMYSIFQDNYIYHVVDFGNWKMAAISKL